MPRKHREDVEGAVHHVYARGNGKQLLFLDDEDRTAYLEMLGRVVGRCGWQCMAYCLMSNHVHLLLETPKANLGQGMRWFHGRYAAAFNTRHRRTGHVFEGRYGSVRMLHEVQLWMAARYIALNPVAAGLCDLPEQWHWSSHRFMLERAEPAWLDSGRLLSYFESVGGDPLERYADLVRRPSRGPEPTRPRR